MTEKDITKRISRALKSLDKAIQAAMKTAEDIKALVKREKGE